MKTHTALIRNNISLKIIRFAAGHIRSVDGFYGCYRGLTPKLVGTICTMVFSEKIANRLGLQAMEDKKDDELLTDEEL